MFKVCDVGPVVRVWFSALVVVAAIIGANIGSRGSLAAEGNTVGPMQAVTPAQFLKLPDAVQAIFIGGLIEGMAFVSYGYSLPDHAAWTACVREKNIGTTAADVVAFLKSHPDFDESIASAFAQVVGQRCKH